MKIIHVLADSVFMDMAIREFDLMAPDVNEYITLGATPYKYILSKRVKDLCVTDFQCLVNDQSVRAVIFHSLPPDRYGLLVQIPNHAKVFWLGWGYDYYNVFLNNLNPSGLVLPDSKKMTGFNRIRPAYKTARRMIGEVVDRLKKIPKVDPRTALQRIDYFIPVLDVEYDMACTYNPWFRPKYITWNYGTIEDDWAKEGFSAKNSRLNLLVGNSGTPTNNHCEVFNNIYKNIDLSGRSVIVPLACSYNKRYDNNVMRLGNKLFGDSFYPITDFVSRDEYIEILGTCEAMLMNHLRQQGLGNVCIGILMGSNIFLNPRNPLYEWLKKKGISCGNVHAVNMSKLSEAQKERNISALREYWGRDAQRFKTRKLIETALS